MILGYVEQPSPQVGERLVLRVSTDAERWQARLRRVTGGRSCLVASEWFAGVEAEPHLPFQDWGVANTGLDGVVRPGWPAYEIPLPRDWSPGVYLVDLVEGDVRRDTAGAVDPVDPVDPIDSRCGRALFVLRAAPGAGPRPILYKLPLFTYHAYNLVLPNLYDPVRRRGHWCLYNMPAAQDVPVPFSPAVSLHRPGGGTGGTPYDTFNVDPFDPTPRQTYVHWDAKMIDWLEREGYDLDFCTDYDLHTLGRRLLEGHRLLLSAGHDEYWSAQMRDAVEGFTGAGGNVAFFGGNVAWWRIVFHGPTAFSREDCWWEVPGRPENVMTGVSFRNGGERDRDEHPVPVGYRVQHSGHWAYAGTGLRDGDVFGDGPDEYVVGYECDGAHFDRADLEGGRPVCATGSDGTPASFEILAVGDTRPSGWGLGNAAATMGVFTQGGTVFTAGTTDWPRVLASGSPVLEQITRNVVTRLGGPSSRPARVAGPAS